MSSSPNSGPISHFPLFILHSSRIHIDTEVSSLHKCSSLFSYYHHIVIINSVERVKMYIPLQTTAVVAALSTAITPSLTSVTSHSTLPTGVPTLPAIYGILPRPRPHHPSPVSSLHLWFAVPLKRLLKPSSRVLLLVFANRKTPKLFATKHCLSYHLARSARCTYQKAERLARHPYTQTLKQTCPSNR